MLGVSVALFLSQEVRTSAQCLYLKYPHNPQTSQFNPDSIMIDTCNSPGSWYAKGRFEIIVSYGILSSGAVADSNGVYTIDDFDTTVNYYDIWDSLNTANGGLKLTKACPTCTDSSSLYIKMYYVSFNNYVNIDSIKSTLFPIVDSAGIRYVNRQMKLLGEPTEPGMLPLKKLSEVAAPMGISYTYDYDGEERYNELGMQKSLYDLHLPMAWEITKGSQNVYVGVDDNFDAGYTGPHQEHQDLSLTTSNPAGNYFYPTPPNQIVKLQDYKQSDGTSGHGFIILNIIASQENGKGLIGVAPQVRVFGTARGTDYSKVDVSPNPGIQTPHVMSISYEGGIPDPDIYKAAIENGVVVAAALTNSLSYSAYDELGNEYQEPRPENIAQCSESDNPINVSAEMGFPSITLPAGNVYTYSSDPNDDIKVLCVKGYDIGSNSDVILPDCKTADRGVLFLRNSTNFSFGANKFSISSSQQERAGDKFRATIDVVAPYPRLYARYYDADIKSRYYRQSSSSESGNSYAVPQVSGIIGLMMSVQDKFGLTGKNVHRRVYDIVTFTADKIADPGVPYEVAHTTAEDPVPEASELADLICSQRTATRKFYPPNPLTADLQPDLLNANQTLLNTDYREMSNDPLKRYWAIRVGFGRVNAFRCLAHSIPGSNLLGLTNTKYQYTSSDNLDWLKGHSLNGKTYLHLGKYKNATELVLEKGGIKYNNEPDYKNNNGKTIVDNDLSVGNAQVLVIDGILTSTTSDKKISTAQTGKILSTGYLHNVKMEGCIKTFDLYVNRTESQADVIVYKALSGSQTNGELHDAMWVRGNSTIVIESGTVTMMPGSTMYLYDGAKVVVKRGATLRMMHGSRILDMRTNNANDCIVLDVKQGAVNGGKLVIDAKAEEVVIDAELVINDGAKLEVGDAMTEIFPNVKVYKVIVKSGGKISTVDKSFIEKLDGNAPGLVIEASEGIRIPTNTTCKLNVPVEIKAGGSVMVDQFSTLKVGALNVRANGLLTVSPGSTLQFLDRENNVHGKLVIAGTSSSEAMKVTVKSAVEPNANCSTLNHVDFANLNILPEAWIYPNGAPTTDPLDQRLNFYLYAQYTKFENVFVTTLNTPILSLEGSTLVAGKLANCEFRTNRDVFTGNEIKEDYRKGTFFSSKWLKQPFRKQRDEFGGVSLFNYLSGMRLVRDLTVSNCSFTDVAGKIITSLNYRSLTREVNDYPVAGLSITGIGTYKVIENKFAFLFYGVNIEGPPSVVSGNKLGGLADGIIVRSAKVCDNDLSGCVNAITSRFNAYSFVFDNRIGAEMGSSVNSLISSGNEVKWVGSGLFINGEVLAFCRNNELSYYGTGLHAHSGTIDARDKFAFRTSMQTNQGDAYVNGRNLFVGSNRLSNPYRKGNEDADMFMGPTGLVNVKCGKNVFSAGNSLQRFQLQKEDQTPPVTIDVSTNEWTYDQVQLIRRNALVVIPPDVVDLRDGQHPYGTEQCSELTRELEVEFECVALPVEDGNPFDPNRALSTINPANFDVLSFVAGDILEGDTAFAKRAYPAALYILSNRGISVASRSASISVAIVAAEGHPQADSVVDELADTLKSIGLDTTQPKSLREKGILGRVDLLVFNEDYINAKGWLDTARITVFGGFDSIDVNLLSDWLGVMGDTAIGFVERRDTLNSLKTLEVEHAKRPDGFSKQPFQNDQLSERTEVSTTFVSYPNPSTGSFTIRYSGTAQKDVKISVYDLLGTTVYSLMLASLSTDDEIILPDLHSVDGTYVVELTSLTGRQASIITMMK
ncbi:MAG: S8 family peptidase [Ignavibacteria bacterium]|nr:S8 family peptidase [Ignavibacteria bacterium]